jgi:streptomycin 6-kinase
MSAKLKAEYATQLTLTRMELHQARVDRDRVIAHMIKMAKRRRVMAWLVGLACASAAWGGWLARGCM